MKSSYIKTTEATLKSVYNKLHYQFFRYIHHQGFESEYLLVISKRFKFQQEPE